jgi:predicted nucleotidyltransferase component of viral defense system
VNNKYKSQITLLIRILPAVARESDLALHGGTAINLFIKEMPRLSVDIDLTYLPIENRTESLKKINAILWRIKADLVRTIPGIKVSGPDELLGESKIICILKNAQVKLEINTINRGSLMVPVFKPLCKTAQKQFGLFAEMPVIHIGQLYGGKICAALDRQHPRDIFDVKFMLEDIGFIGEIKHGFLFCLLSSARPLNELLNPSLIDQRSALDNHFIGLTTVSFNYEDYERTRDDLITNIGKALTDEDKKFLVSFKSGTPYWNLDSFKEFEKFPAVQWKLQNIQNLKENDPAKHKLQLESLKNVLNRNGGKL